MGPAIRDLSLQMNDMDWWNPLDYIDLFNAIMLVSIRFGQGFEVHATLLFRKAFFFATNLTLGHIAFAPVTFILLIPIISLFAITSFFIGIVYTISLVIPMYLVVLPVYLFWFKNEKLFRLSSILFMAPLFKIAIYTGLWK